MKYTRSDGWLFYSIMGKQTVYNLISTGDYLNRAIFKYEEIDQGLNRLIKNGLVSQKGSRFYKTKKGKALEKNKRKRLRGPIEEMLHFQDVFEKLDMEEQPNLLQTIVSKYDYELAVDKFNGNTKKYILKSRLKRLTREQKEVLSKFANSATYAKGNLEVHNFIIEYEEYYGAMAYNILHKSIKALIPKYSMLCEKDFMKFNELIKKYPNDSNLKEFIDALTKVDGVLKEILNIQGVAI